MKPRTRQSDDELAGRPKPTRRPHACDELDESLVRRYGRAAFSRDIVDNRRRRQR